MTELSEVTWNETIEEYFVEQGEQAHGLSLLHKQSETLYSRRRTFIELPVIAISSITGFLSVGSSTMFEGEQMASSVSLGILSLIVSVLQTIGTYFGWAKRAEAHRLSAIQYARLYRFLAIELGLPREERMTPTDLLKYTKDSYDRLQEVSPLIPPELVAEFRKKFGKDKELSKPEELNGLDKIKIFADTFTIRNPMNRASSEVVVEVKTPGSTVDGATT